MSRADRARALKGPWSYLSKYSEILHYCASSCESCLLGFPHYLPICPAGENFHLLSYYMKGKAGMAHALYRGTIEFKPEVAHIFFACPLCGACTKVCCTEWSGYALEVMEAVRAEAVRAGIGPMLEQRRFGESVKREHNPYFEPHSSRRAWLPKRDLPKDARFLYFVGCTSSYRQKNIALATLKILERMGIDFTILEDEWCCGSPLLRTGQWDLAAEQARHNVKAIQGAGTEKVITSCAGCYRAWKRDWKEAYKELLGMDYDFEVIHITELLAEGFDALGAKEPLKAKIAYHDPCHLGRHCGVYEPPREVLSKIPGLELVEMERNRDGAWCCGAGGGFRASFKEFSIKTAIERIREAERAGAEAIATSCPFCWRNLSDAASESGSRLKVYDVVELVEKAL